MIEIEKARKKSAKGRKFSRTKKAHPGNKIAVKKSENAIFATSNPTLMLLLTQGVSKRI